MFDLYRKPAQVPIDRNNPGQQTVVNRPFMVNSPFNPSSPQYSNPAFAARRAILDSLPGSSASAPLVNPTGSAIGTPLTGVSTPVTPAPLSPSTFPSAPISPFTPSPPSAPMQPNPVGARPNVPIEQPQIPGQAPNNFNSILSTLLQNPNLLQMLFRFSPSFG